MVNWFDLIFSGGINEQLTWFIIALVIAILISSVDRLLFDLIPNVIVGIAWLSVLVTLVLWLGRNFITNTWQTATGKAVIISIILIVLALIFTTEFVKTRDKTIKVIQYITPSPSKVGQNVKIITKNIKRRK